MFEECTPINDDTWRAKGACCTHHHAVSAGNTCNICATQYAREHVLTNHSKEAIPGALLLRVGRGVTYPSVYHAPPWDKAEEGLSLFHISLADATDQAMEPTKSNLNTAGQIKRV